MAEIDVRGKAAAKREYFERILEARESNVVVSLDEQLNIILTAYLDNLTPPKEKVINGRYRGHSNSK